MQFQEINLEKIAPSPLNPRKHFDGPKFDELVASVREKGVIEPVIIRPSGKKIPYELVAGERRFRAAGDCKLPTIPAIIRELTDDEAYDFMLIENLHREDLTELEEAESFKAYVDRHGEDEIQTFAGKTGISPRYIRTRIHVLNLPKDVLAMWRDGKLKYGHLEQLLRVADESVRGELVKRLKTRGWGQINTVAELRKEIDELQIPLSAARFEVKAGCAGCQNNSTVQKDLFGLGDGKASCLNPGCFRAYQRDWFKKNWATTSFRKDYKTNGAAFDDEINYSQRETFETWSKKPGPKCFDCDQFVTLLEINGKVKEKQACLKPACYRALAEPGREGSGKKANSKPGEPRAAWHGEYFRDHFFRPRIEAKISELDLASPKGLALLSAAAAKAHGWYTVQESIGKVLGLKGCGNTGHGLVAAILKADKQKLEKVARATISSIVMDGQSIEQGWNSDGFGTVNRAAVGRFLGIDLAKEYVVNEEYLQKKTTAEILAFIKKFNLAKVPAFQKALKGQVPEKSKKSELVKAVLAIGADLVGKVPDEILNVGKDKKGSGRDED